MLGPVRWKQIHGFPLYEISEEGQIRMTLDHPQYPGHIKRRFRWVYEGNRKGRAVNYADSLHLNGTLYVDMTNGTLSDGGVNNALKAGRARGNPRYKRSIAKLMDRHWPGVLYPADWVSDKGVIFDPRVRRGKKGLTDHEMLKIMDDDRDPTTVWKEIGLGRSRAWIHQIHQGRCSLARRLQEYGRAALHEAEATYWWDSDERGHRIKRLISGDLPGPKPYRISKDRANYV